MPRTLHLVENASVPTDPRVWPECLALRDAGWDVSVICPTGDGYDTAEHEMVDGIEIRRFRPVESSGGALGYVREYGVALWQMRGLAHELSRTRTFDVVHAASPPDVLLLASRHLRRAGAATIFDHHDLSPELFEVRSGGGPIHHALVRAESLGFRLADVVISANESFKHIAIERGRKRPEDVFVVRNGPDPDVFRPVARDATLGRGAPHLIGYVGRMGRQDGVHEALNVLERLLEARSDWHAVFAGDGEALASARRVVSEGPLASHVSFLGYVAEKERVVEILSSCDVCISPEPHNALNDRSTLIKVAEYMAVARPVVAFDLAETALTAGAAAVLVDRVEAFAGAISSLLDDPDRRRVMGEEGRRRVVETLGWFNSVKPLHDAYARALMRGTERKAVRTG